jgi:hypothetical protein
MHKLPTTTKLHRNLTQPIFQPSNVIWFISKSKLREKVSMRAHCPSSKPKYIMQRCCRKDTKGIDRTKTEKNIKIGVINHRNITPASPPNTPSASTHEDVARGRCERVAPMVNLLVLTASNAYMCESIPVYSGRLRLWSWLLARD